MEIRQIGKVTIQPHSCEIHGHFIGNAAPRIHAKQVKTNTTTAPQATRSVPKLNDSQNIERKLYRESLTQPRVCASEGSQRLDTLWEGIHVSENGFEDMKTTDIYNFYKAENKLLEDQDEMDAGTRHKEASHQRETTITTSERAAFEAIFKNVRIKATNAWKHGGLGYQSVDHAAHGRAKGRLESLMERSVSESFPQTRDEIETVVNRYPPFLRALAAGAVELNYDKARSEEIAQNEALDNDGLEELRRPICKELESKMRAAETDSALWEIMEKEVFSLMEKLGLEEGRKDEIAKQHEPKPAIITKVNTRNVVLPPDYTDQFQPITHMGQETSPLALYGPLYPSYLLLGLRLFDRSFTKPSPLTLSILPKIKSLGLISHVLGASTHLYNELLVVYWYRYDDFRAVNGLLSEMEGLGVPYNNETLDIISDILRMQGRILRGDRGPTLKALWHLPEFAPGKFGSWYKKIKQMLNDRVNSGGHIS